MRRFLLVAIGALVAGQHARAEVHSNVPPPAASMPPYRELAKLDGINVQGLAQDGAFVYVGVRDSRDTAATIFKIPKAGGLKVAIYTGPDLPGAMAAQPSGVYFTRATADGGVMVAPTGSGVSKRLDKVSGDAAVTLRTQGVTPVQEFQFLAPFDNLVVDGNQIFVSSTLAKVVGVLPKAGGKIRVIAMSDREITGLATQGKEVVFTTRDGRVCRVGKNGKGLAEVVAGRTMPHDVVAFRDDVAWAEGKLAGPANLVHFPRGAKVPVPLAFPAGVKQLSNLAVGGDVLWYVSADQWGTRRIAQVPVAGGPALERPGAFGIDAVVADAHAVYFIGLGKDGKYKYVGAFPR